MQLYLIRHAQSENNALWEQTGDSLGRSMDPELTELGRSQARLIYQNRLDYMPAELLSAG